MTSDTKSSDRAEDRRSRFMAPLCKVFPKCSGKLGPGCLFFAKSTDYRRKRNYEAIRLLGSDSHVGRGELIPGVLLKSPRPVAHALHAWISILLTIYNYWCR